PEAFSPQGVQELQVVYHAEGVSFAWKAPSDDLQGKELKTLNGYRIYRKEIVEREDLLAELSEYELIETIVDTHVEERERLREEARAAGRPARRIDAPSELTKFSYMDRNVEPGEVYAYRIVPFNQRDVEGLSPNIIRVLFRGASSEVSLVGTNSFEDALQEFTLKEDS